MEAYKQEFIKFMVESDVLKFGSFTLKSGRQSPFFMNAGAYVTGYQLKKLGEYYAQAIHDNFGDDFDVLFGPAYKGIPLAVVTAIAYHELYGKEVKYCCDRKEAKDHGADKGNLLGYEPQDGDRVVMVEDVTTSGKSIDETYPKVKAAADVEIKGLIVSLNRRRKSTANKEALLDSEWASASVTTDAAPDKSGYLLYKDFENLPGGGQPFYGAYGFSLGSTTDFSDPDKILITTGDANSIYCQGVKDNDSYFSAYLPEWDRADWKANSFNVGLAAGYMKFGGGSNPAWLTLPKLSSLSGATEIELEFDACPYYEPSTKGDMMAPSNTDITEYFGVTVSGATIVSVTGETSADAVISGGGTTVTLRNVLVDKMIEEGLKDTYRYTTHKVKITGVTADTRIKIYSALEDDDKNHRMWLDNLKVKKVN